jgi:hypothetical protein
LKIPFWTTKYLRIGSLLLQIHYGEFERDHAMNLDTKGASGVPHCVSALINGWDWLWTRVTWEIIWMKNCRWYNSWTPRRINKAAHHIISLFSGLYGKLKQTSMRSANWNHVTWLGKLNWKPIKNLKILNPKEHKQGLQLSLTHWSKFNQSSRYVQLWDRRE